MLPKLFELVDEILGVPYIGGKQCYVFVDVVIHKFTDMFCWVLAATEDWTCRNKLFVNFGKDIEPSRRRVGYVEIIKCIIINIIQVPHVSKNFGYLITEFLGWVFSEFHIIFLV